MVVEKSFEVDRKRFYFLAERVQCQLEVHHLLFKFSSILTQKMFQAPTKNRTWAECLSCSQSIQESSDVGLIVLLDIRAPLEHEVKSACQALEASMCSV